MTKKAQTTLASPEAIIYTQLKLPSEVPAGDSLSEELSKLISLEVQGEAVEISEEYPLPILMAAFDVVHRVSPEMVLRLKNGKRVLLFDHWGGPVLRDRDIQIVQEVTEHKKTKKFVAELNINLEDIWEKASANKDDNLETINKALEEAEKLIKPSMITTLTGKAPTLIFLLTQHLLYGKTGEIWYQKSSSSAPTRITQIL